MVDLYEKTLFSIEKKKNEAIIKINVDALKKGIYIIQINSQRSGKVFHKIIIL